MGLRDRSVVDMPLDVASFLLVVVMALLAGCGDSAGRDTGIEEIRAAGTLRLLTLNSPTTYYEGATGPAGFEYDLAADFATHLGVTLDVHVKDSVEEILLALEHGEGDIAAAGLTGLESRRFRFQLGPEYFRVEQQLVCRRGAGEPKKITDLHDRRLHVIADSSYSEHLHLLQQTRLPSLQWTEESGVGTEELLHRVANGDIDCTVGDSNIIRINRRYLPSLSVVENLTPSQPLNWMMPISSQTLNQITTDWFSDIKKEGKLAELEAYYYDYIPLHDFVDLRAFHRRIDQRLPKYRELFQNSGERHDIPWQFLAAQSYQESHWDPVAKSPTGVRGMMMLTQPTAKSVGVTNRLDPQQSIDGGALYLKGLIGRIPESVTDPTHRLQMALAAYNVGMGHLYDARTLAQRMGKNQDDWLELREVLPLLGQKKYYQTLRYGYARGWEPVAYVDKVRHYYNILDERTMRDTLTH